MEKDSPLATIESIFHFPFQVDCVGKFQSLIQGGSSENGRSSLFHFATHHPNCTDVQALLNILLIADERQLVINKVNEEIHYLHQEIHVIPNPSRAIPWDLSSGDLDLPEHYKRCILEGLKKGVPKQKSLNLMQVVQRKPNEDPSVFLERIYQAFPIESTLMLTLRHQEMSGW